MTEQHIAICEALDWRVHDDPEEDYVELEKYSPAGEDFIFGVQKRNFVKNVREYADDFDVDEHVELWIAGRGKNGVPATARELVEGAEAIRDMLNELAEALFLSRGGDGMNLKKHKKGDPYNVGPNCFVTFCTSGNNIVARLSSRARSLIGTPSHIRVRFEPKTKLFAFSRGANGEDFTIVQGRILAFQIRRILEIELGIQFRDILGRHPLIVQDDELILNLFDRREATQ